MLKFCFAVALIVLGIACSQDAPTPPPTSLPPTIDVAAAIATVASVPIATATSRPAPTATPTPKPASCLPTGSSDPDQKYTLFLETTPASVVVKQVFVREGTGPRGVTVNATICADGVRGNYENRVRVSDRSRIFLTQRSERTILQYVDGARVAKGAHVLQVKVTFANGGKISFPCRLIEERGSVNTFGCR